MSSNKVSVIMFPVEDFSSFVILLSALDSAIFWFHESIPISPVGILDLCISIFVGITLLKGDQLVEISEHIDED